MHRNELATLPSAEIDVSVSHANCDRVQFSAQLKSPGNTVQTDPTQKYSVFAHLARLSDFSKCAYVAVADQFYLYKIRE